MGRLPLLTDQPDDRVVAGIYEQLRTQGRVPPDLYRTLAHAPKMLEAWVGMAWPLRSEPAVSRALRELAIMRTALLTGAEYEWAHHWDMAVQAGVGEARLRALADWERSQAFADEERAVLAYTDEIVANDVRDETFAELERHFPPAEVIELTLTAAFYACVGRVLRALRVDLEPGYEDQLGAMPAVTPLGPSSAT